MSSVELKKIVKTFYPKRRASIFSFQNELFSNKPEREKGFGKTSMDRFRMGEIDLFLPEGKTMVILGPSGCGKTTLLRIVAGLEKCESGQILFDGKDVTSLPPRERGIGMVFQNYALYPHMTARSNVLSFFFFHRKTKNLELLKNETFQKTSELMGVDIEYLLDRDIPKLSGGEKQRVAMARCITRNPSVFLLDEPFSNLDAKLREKYRMKLKSLLSQLKVTTLYVTHDQQEAMILADLIAVMDYGVIVQVGTYDELYKNPVSVFVAEFLNPSPETPAINLFDGETVSAELSAYRVGVRPEDLVVVEKPEDADIRAIVVSARAVPTKEISALTLMFRDKEIFTTISTDHEPEPGSEIFLTFRKKHLFLKETGMTVHLD